MVMVGATLTNAASGGTGTGAITYQSSNTSVLTVNATSGVATGVAIGAATVTATKAADASFSQAQATYTVSVQTTSQMSAYIGATATEVFLPQVALGKQFVSALADTCPTPENAATCMNAQSTVLTGTLFHELTSTLTTPTYYALRSGSVTANATLVSSQRFSERIGHAALFFKNRYWVIGGGEPLLPSSATPAPHKILGDIWSSADGKTWKLETDTAPFAPRWFHQAVVFNNQMWVISGTPTPTLAFSDVWSSEDGVAWTLRTPNMALPSYATYLNVIVFNGAMWAIAGGTAYSSADGVTWTPRSAVGAIGSGTARAYASLTLYDGNLWYIGGADTTGEPAFARNDVWKSADGINWTRVTAAAPFTRRIRHAAFVMNGRLWVFGGEIPDGLGGSSWALDAWSTTDGATWTVEPTGGLDGTYLAKVIEQTGPERVTLIGGIQRGYSNNVWQTTNGLDWTALSSNAPFSPRTTYGVEFQGQLWIFGGATADGKASGADSNDIWRSGDGINWTRVATTGTIFSARDGHRVVLFKNKLWVIGGWDGMVGSGGTETRLNDVWSSDDGIAWTKHDPTGGVIFSQRVGHDVAVYQDKLWVIGGSVQNGVNENDVWSSPDGDTWTLVQADAAFSGRVSHRVVPFANELWLTGGGTSLGTSEVWHSQDGNTWTQVNPSTPFAPRLRHEAAAFNGRLYVVGGVSGEEYLPSTLYNDVWSTADGTHWTQDTANAEFAGRWHPALIPHTGELWLVGGYGLSFSNEVWRSNDGKNWRLGFSHDIVVP